MSHIDSINTEEQDQYMSDKRAYRRGKQAVMERIDAEDCPYEEGTELYSLWYMGYNYIKAVEKR